MWRCHMTLNELIQHFRGDEKLISLIKMGYDKPAVMHLLHSEKNVNKHLARQVVEALKKSLN